MVNELRDLLHESAAEVPPDDRDLSVVLRTGRRRVRVRRFGVVGGTALATVAVVGTLVVVGSRPVPIGAAAGVVPEPVGPVLRLSDAERAVEGGDYRVLASYTNDNLDRDNGQYFEGVTEDGLILFRDGPRLGQLQPRFALLDPATGEKDWLPDLQVDQVDMMPLELGRDRVVLLDLYHFVVHTWDRSTGRWSSREFTDVPKDADPRAAALGPDGRLYLPVLASSGRPPAGGWPTGPDGEADDAGADGQTYDLWSAPLSDPGALRDEHLVVGSFAFTEDSLVWTDATNGAPGRVHVRDLASGEEHAFDPRTGDRCNLLSFGATDDRIVMSQYCGTYEVDEGAVRDDRVQVLTTDGDQVATLQDNGVEGTLPAGADVVTIVSYDSMSPGSYAYDLENDRFLRMGDEVSSWPADGLTRPGQVMWSTPVNRGHGATQWLGELIDQR